MSDNKKTCSLCEGTGIERDKVCRKCQGNGSVKVAASIHSLMSLAETDANYEETISQLLRDVEPPENEAELVNKNPEKLTVSYEGTGLEMPLPLDQTIDDVRLIRNISGMLRASSDKSVDRVFNLIADMNNVPADQREVLSTETKAVEGNKQIIASRWKQLEFVYEQIEKMKGDQLSQIYSFVRNTE